MAPCSTTPSLPKVSLSAPLPLISFSAAVGQQKNDLQKCSRKDSWGERRRHLKSQFPRHWCLSLVVAFKGYWNSQPQCNIYRMGLNHIMSQGFWGTEQMPREWPAQSVQSILGLVFLSWPTLNTSHWSPRRMKSNTLAYLTFCSEKSLFINRHHPNNTTLNLCSGGWETQQRRLPITWRLRMRAWHVWYNSLLTRKCNYPEPTTTDVWERRLFFTTSPVLQALFSSFKKAINVIVKSATMWEQELLNHLWNVICNYYSYSNALWIAFTFASADILGASLRKERGR